MAKPYGRETTDVGVGPLHVQPKGQPWRSHVVVKRPTWAWDHFMFSPKGNHGEAMWS